MLSKINDLARIVVFILCSLITAPMALFIDTCVITAECIIAWFHGETIRHALRYFRADSALCAYLRTARKLFTR